MKVNLFYYYVPLVIFLWTCKLRFYTDAAADSPTLEDTNKADCKTEKANSVSDFSYQRNVILSDGSNKTTRRNFTIKRHKRNFIPPKRFWWDQKSIPYMLDKSLGVTGRKAFQAAVAEFERNTCIRFVKHTNEKDYIWVHRGKGCFSSTGKSGGRQPLSLGKGCRTMGVVIHELLHALGMMHEHCRADRDQFISIKFNNIRPKAKVEFQILNGYIIGEPYDYGSVMHYGYYYFSLDPKIPTIVKLMPGGPRIGQRRGFSDLDLRKINKFYKCKNYTKAIRAPQKEKFKIVSGDCSFERGLCNWKNWKNKVEDQFDWKIGRIHDFSSGKAHAQPCGRFIFFKKPSSQAEYMSSGVLYSGFFSGSCCLRFYYHMTTGGYLRVFINEAESKRRNPYVLVWERVGPQGDKWNKMEKSISGADKPYKIYIEGIKTPDLTGLVAVDDVCVAQGRSCNCKWN